MSTAAPPSPPTQPQPRRLTRSRSDRVIGGVAGGLGQYFGVDAVVFRIGLAAAVFAGGIGAFVYIAALLFVPSEDGTPTPFDRHRVLTVIGAVILGIAVLSALDGDWFWGPIVPLAIVAAVGYAIYRTLKREGHEGPLTAGRVLTWLAIGAGAMLALTALAVGAAWAAAEGSGVVVAGLVIAIGVALLISALRPGGARWLALPALAIAVPLGVVAAADVSFEGGFGERSYRPATLAALPADGYRLGAGEMVVDLRQVSFPAGQETVVDVGVGTGRVEVLVPEDVCVTTDARVGGGYVNVRGRDAGGLDLDFALQATAVTAPRVLVKGDVGFGALEVVDQPRDAETGGRDDDGPFDDVHDGDPRTNDHDPGDEGVVTDGGCTNVEYASAG